MIDKVAALLRFIMVKLAKRGVQLPRVSYIGRHTLIQGKNGGTISARGKIRLDHDTELVSLGSITLGENFVMNGYSRIVAHQRIEIGNNVVIARFVSILDHDHAFEKNASDGSLVFDGYNMAPIRIGNNVWLGDKVSILKGVTIGDNVIIGANAVVTKDIPSNTIAGGIPAKVIKHL
ncbi:acyltransferase [Paraflavitalea pollutisoli]|uniref:acyltransferase n=1 Tax=Paraflavitalea pollutisoli TaxID=3034143 RepID=UPI0023EAD52A|nr:acyltransferase [Paraflavitalea sp. H1-2-19X]